MAVKSTTNVPNGTQEFLSAVERLENASPQHDNKFILATECCKLCNAPTNYCEDCFVQTLGDLKDPYRKQIQSRTNIGMYSSGMYKDNSGKYHYAHPQGSD